MTQIHEINIKQMSSCEGYILRFLLPFIVLRPQHVAIGLK